jgi:hypothetical protein
MSDSAAYEAYSDSGCLMLYAIICSLEKANEIDTVPYNGQC